MAHHLERAGDHQQAARPPGDKPQQLGGGPPAAGVMTAHIGQPGAAIDIGVERHHGAAAVNQPAQSFGHRRMVQRGENQPGGVGSGRLLDLGELRGHVVALAFPDMDVDGKIGKVLPGVG